MRQDENLQECQGPFLKKSFPDLDYALKGYNVLKGYPQAIGRDPGLTNPIFYADYTGQRQTSDCRYSIPAGLYAAPDVSCQTSFKSEEITTSYQLSKSLGVQANVQGGGWGVSFSASAGYKQASSEMSTGQSVYVMSTASCKYYYTSMDMTSPPPFEPGFLRWSEKLLNSSDDEVNQFIDYYGTHFLKEVTFGAKYIFQHKMSSQSYKSLSSSEFSVSVQASYSGAFSVGGGFGMDSSQSQAASQFSKSVETTTISIGAPPPSNGDAMTWASTVKDTPVPVFYSMASIEDLFTPQFMSHVSFDYNKVKKILEHSRESGRYCKFLRTEGLVNSCEDFSAGYKLENTEIRAPYQHRTTDLQTCIDDCLRDRRCVAIDYIDSSCCFYSGTVRGYKRETCATYIFQHKIQSLAIPLMISAHVPNDPREASNQTSPTACETSCLADTFCDAFEFCDRHYNSWCHNFINNCHLFSMKQIKSLEESTHSNVTFVIRREPTTPTPTTPTPATPKPTKTNNTTPA